MLGVLAETVAYYAEMLVESMGATMVTNGYCCDVSSQGGVCLCYEEELDKRLPKNSGVREQMRSIVEDEPLDAGNTLMGSIAHECVRLKLAEVNDAGQYLSTEYGRSLVKYWDQLQ